MVKRIYSTPELLKKNSYEEIYADGAGIHFLHRKGTEWQEEIFPTPLEAYRAFKEAGRKDLAERLREFYCAELCFVYEV